MQPPDGKCLHFITFVFLKMFILEFWNLILKMKTKLLMNKNYTAVRQVVILKKMF